MSSALRVLLLGGLTAVRCLAGPGWFDPAWTYRSTVTITNPNGITLTSFQVNVTLGSSFAYGLVKSDGSDIRFTAADGTTLLPFWIEQWNPSGGSASLWVNVPSVPPSGATVYMYYGNPQAASASDGNATFDFFEYSPGGYWPLSAPQTVLTATQAWETASPHTLSIVQANKGGYTYWGYYGLQQGCGGIGLAQSNDLVNWTKYASNPLFANGRWPYVVLLNGTYYMAYEVDYCTSASYINLASSTDGVNFTVAKTLVAPQSNTRNQNPDIFYNPVDGKFYLYWYRGDDSTYWEIHARSAASILNLDQTGSEVTVLRSKTTLAAPDMLYYNNTYYLSTETLNGGNWNVQVYSSSSPTGGFNLLPNDPVLSDNAACMFQYVIGSTLHAYDCRIASGTWILEHRSADLTQPVPPQIDLTKFTASGGTWSVVNDVKPNGSTGPVLQGLTSARQTFTSNYRGTDYVLQLEGRQIAGRVWGAGVRASDVSNLYSVNLYDDLNTTKNLYLYSWVNNAGSSATATLGSAAVGQVTSGAWYKLMIKVSSSNIQVYKDGVLKIQASDASLPSGGIALYGEANTIAEFDNVLVRKYANADPTATASDSGGSSINSVTLNPSTVTGGAASQGTVYLSNPAPAGGALVVLSSSNSSVAGVPPNLTIPSGASSGNFTVTTSSVTVRTGVTITATYQGGSQFAVLTVNPAPDTTPPTVAITSPPAGATLSGQVTLQAGASDNVAVAGVQFQVDGTNISSLQTSPPYQVVWDTTTVSNGQHTIRAVATDTSGNQATASETVTVSNTVTLPAPAAYWSFEPAMLSGNTALDQSANALNATMYNTTTTPGAVGQALSLNGSGSYLAVTSGNSGLLDFNASMTLVAWIRTTNSTRVEAILSKYDSAGTESGYLLKSNPDGTLTMRFGGHNLAVYGSHEVSDTTPINDGHWHLAGIVMNLGQSVQFYVDGHLSSTAAISTAAASSGAPFEMGALPFTYYGNYFTGSLDEVRVYAQALTAGQMAVLYGGGPAN